MAGQRRTKVGRVVSDKMDKTVVVSVERLQRHPIYKRVIRRSTKFKAHDQDNAARVGDTVGSRRAARCRATSAGAGRDSRPRHIRDGVGTDGRRGHPQPRASR